MSNTSNGENFAGTTRGAASIAGVSLAGVLLAVSGLFQVIEGITALAKDKVYATGVNYVFEFDVTSWGWIHLILGIIAIIVAVGILMGQSWGLIFGVVIAAIGALACFAFMPYYPFWNIITLALYIFVIWAMVVQMANRDDF